jgi:hypothetical protein
MVKERNKSMALVAVVILGLATSIALSRWLDANRPSWIRVWMKTSTYRTTDCETSQLLYAFSGLAAD